MTVSSTTNKVSYSCNGSQTVFDFTFKIFAESDLVVTLVDSNGNENTLVLNTHYTISPEPWPNGGSITTITEDPYDSGNTLVILRQLPLTQAIDYLTSGNFPAETHEEGLDRAVMILQEAMELTKRCLAFKVDSNFSDLTLPDPVAGQYLRWKPDSSGLENIASGDFGDAPNCYTKTMTENETFIYPGGNHLRCFLDPGGANRNFNPSGSFPSGFKIEIINKGQEIITFDSAVSPQNIGPGQRGVFLYSSYAFESLVSSKAGIEYVVDPSETDQGATGNGRSIKAYVDAIGTSRKATIKLKHTSINNETVYNLSTVETIPSNITFEIEDGAILDGAGTLTVNGPFEHGLSQCFGSDITVNFGNKSIKEDYPQWWGAVGDYSADDEPMILKAIKAVVTGCKRTYVPKGNYLLGSTLDFADAFGAASYFGFEFICHPEAYFTANDVSVNPIVALRTAIGGQFLCSQFEFGFINGNSHGVNGLIVSNISDSQITINKVIGCANSNGVYLLIPDATDGLVANNFIHINRIMQCGNGLALRSPSSGNYGIQANQIFIGQIIECAGNGVIVGTEGKDVSDRNIFYLGAIEHNGICGIRDYTGHNKYIISSTNSNTTGGFRLEANAGFTKIDGCFEDATPFTDLTAGKLCVNGVHYPITFTDGDTDPDVSSGSGKYHMFLPTNFVCANTGATVITLFHDGTPGQIITVRIDGNTTIQNNANMLLEGGANFSGDANDVIFLLCVAANAWREISRSIN